MLPDHALLLRVIEEEGIDATPGGGTGSLASALKEWLWELLGRHDGPELPDWLRVTIGLLIVFAAVGVVLYLLWPSLRRAWLALTQPVAPEPVSNGAATEALPAAADPEAELEAALARGDARAALHAVWELIVARLVAEGRGRADRDLTHREFVATVRATDPAWSGIPHLERLGRQVDRLAYGQAAPAIDDVRGLVHEARSL